MPLLTKRWTCLLALLLQRIVVCGDVSLFLLLLDAERFGFESLTDEQRDVVRKSLNDNVLPRHLGFLDKLLEESPSGWLAGTVEPTIADFIFAPRLKWLISGALEGISTDLFAPFPRVVAFLERFYALPEVVAYYEGKK